MNEYDHVVVVASTIITLLVEILSFEIKNLDKSKPFSLVANSTRRLHNIDYALGKL